MNKFKKQIIISKGFKWGFGQNNLGQTSLDPRPVPPELDYEMWLGPAPYKPYHPHRVHRSFRGYWDYDGGVLADMGQHYMDPVQYFMIKRSSGHLDLQNVIDYGKKHDIGVILYVNRRAMEKQEDKIFPVYKSWGIAGIKHGYVNVGNQKWTSWLHESVRKAAAHKFLPFMSN